MAKAFTKLREGMSPDAQRRAATETAFNLWFDSRFPNYGYNGEDGTFKEAAWCGWEACAEYRGRNG